jgi:hypothetical protein
VVSDGDEPSDCWTRSAWTDEIEIYLFCVKCGTPLNLYTTQEGFRWIRSRITYLKSVQPIKQIRQLDPSHPTECGSTAQRKKIDKGSHVILNAELYYVRFHHNLRPKAWSRQLPAVSERDLAVILRLAADILEYLRLLCSPFASVYARPLAVPAQE